MAAARKDIIISRGMDFYYPLAVQTENGVDYDLTGYTAAAKVRAEPESAAVILAFVCTITVPDTGGPILITATAVATASLPLGIYHWDLIITNPSAPDIKLLKGKATVEATASI